MQLQPLDAPPIPEDFHYKLRKRFFDKFSQQLHQSQGFNSSICFFKGVPTMPKHYDDTEYIAEQQSTFWYLFGVKETDCYAVIENNSGNTVLFVPHYPQEYKMWMYVKPIEKFKEDYKLQKIMYVDELEEYLSTYKPTHTYLFSGTDSDSGLEVAEPENKYLKHCPNIDRKALWEIICNLRVRKTQDQIQLMRYVCKLATDAHIKVIKSVKPGLTQIQCATLFQFEHSIRCGCPHYGFQSICSSGQDCATLHYIENDKVIEAGQMLLHDMGGKWYGYCADQAITFPVDGKFTEKQKHIYNAVYYAQKAVLEVLKEGSDWTQMHLLAQKVILQHLIEIGIVNKFPMEELQQKRVGAIFFPHGLGHLLGLRVHDIGGYTEGPERSKEQGLKSLRTRRIMEDGIIVTVEPGCYFIDYRIKDALDSPEMSKYVNAEKIEEYREVGGVRLEDNVVVRKDGVEMLSFLPRKWEEVEKIMAEK